MTLTVPAEVHETQRIIPPPRSPRARRVWTGAGLLLAIALVLVLALTMVGSTAYQPLASRQRVFSTPITGVTVESSGNITVAPGVGVGAVVTTTGVHGLTNPTDEEHVVGHTLVIRSSCGRTLFNDRCSRNYVLHLPSEVAVTADSAQGDVQVTGAHRSVSAHTDEGDITITGGSGSLHVSSGQGDVTISRSTATAVSASAGQGDVVVDLLTSPNRVTATSGQGSVAVEVPRGPNSYQVHASSGEGNVANALGDNPVSHRVVTVSSGQGDVTVGYRPH
jgi:hypothetical protein